jgi:hypothetical protein
MRYLADLMRNFFVFFFYSFLLYLVSISVTSLSYVSCHASRTLMLMTSLDEQAPWCRENADEMSNVTIASMDIPARAHLATLDAADRESARKSADETEIQEAVDAALEADHFAHLEERKSTAVAAALAHASKALSELYPAPIPFPEIAEERAPHAPEPTVLPSKV